MSADEGGGAGMFLFRNPWPSIIIQISDQHLDPDPGNQAMLLPAFIMFVVFVLFLHFLLGDTYSFPTIIMIAVVFALVFSQLGIITFFIGAALLGIVRYAERC
jgi:hypothetical protein